MNSRKNGSARIWLVAPVASAICVLAPLSSAQEAPSSSVAAVAATPEVIPLRAIVMDVAGKARWRASASGSWKGAEVNDLLDPGAEVQTGTDSRVTLRVGKNATVLVDQNTVFRIPEIVQDGETLRTVAAVQRGRVDMKVDHLGLQNDFKVSTPSTTLAVKGTDLAVSEGSLMGFEVFGARTNAMNAIELKYALSNLKYFLSGAAASSSRLQDPVQKAWLNTLGPPAIAGLLSSLAEQEQKASQGFTNSEGATNTGSSASRLSEAKTETRGTTGTALTEAQLDSYAARAVDAEQAAAGLRDVWVTGRRLAIDFRALAQQRGVLAKSAYDAHVAAVNAAQVAALEAGVQLGIANAEKNGAAADHVAANQQLDQVVADIEAHKYESAELGTDEANSLIDSAGAHADASAAAALAAMMQSAAASEASTASTNAIQKYFVALGLTIQAANGSNSASVITKAASDLCAQFAALSQHFADLSTRGGAFQAAANAHALANAAANSAVVALNARNQALQAAQLASTYAQMILFTAAAEAAQQALDHANAAADAAAIAAAEAELAAALRTEYAVLAAERALAQEINAANAAGLAVDFRNLALQKEVEAGLAKDAHNAAVADAQAAADAASAALQSAILARDETASHLGAAVAAASNAAASMAQGSDQALLVDAPAFVSESQQQANLADGSATAAEGFRDAAETAKNFAIDHSMSAEQAGNQFLAAVEAANKAAADASSQSDIAKTASDLAAAYAQLAWTLSQAAGTDEASMAAVNAATSAYNAGQHALAAMLARDMALSAADAATSLGEKVLWGAAAQAAKDAMDAFTAAVTVALAARADAIDAANAAAQSQQALVDAQTEAAIQRMLSATTQAGMAEAQAQLADGFRLQAEIYAGQATDAAQLHLQKVDLAEQSAQTAFTALQSAIASRIAAEEFAIDAQKYYGSTLGAIHMNNLSLAGNMASNSGQAAQNSQLAANDAFSAAGMAATAAGTALDASMAADQAASDYFSALNVSQNKAQGAVSAHKAAEAASMAAQGFATASGLLASAAGTAEALDAAQAAANQAQAAANSATAALKSRDAALHAAEMAGSMGQKVFYGHAAVFADAAAGSAAQAAKEALAAQVAATAAAGSAAAANNAYQLAVNGTGSSAGGSSN